MNVRTRAQTKTMLANRVLECAWEDCISYLTKWDVICPISSLVAVFQLYLLENYTLIKDPAPPYWLNPFRGPNVPALHISMSRKRMSSRHAVLSVHGSMVGITLHIVYIHPTLRRQGIVHRLLSMLVEFVAQSERLGFLYIEDIRSDAMYSLLMNHPVSFSHITVADCHHFYWIRRNSSSHAS